MAFRNAFGRHVIMRQYLRQTTDGRLASIGGALEADFNNLLIESRLARQFQLFACPPALQSVRDHNRTSGVRTAIQSWLTESCPV